MLCCDDQLFRSTRTDVNHTFTMLRPNQYQPIERSEMLIEVILSLPGLAGWSRPEFNWVCGHGHKLETDGTTGNNENSWEAKQCTGVTEDVVVLTNVIKPFQISFISYSTNQGTYSKLFVIVIRNRYWSRTRKIVNLVFYAHRYRKVVSKTGYELTNHAEKYRRLQSCRCLVLSRIYS